MATRDYYQRLLTENTVSQAEERRMLLAFVASIGAERSLCDYARTYLAEGGHAPLSRNWDLSSQERTHSAGGEWHGHPDSFPPNFQDR